MIAIFLIFLGLRYTFTPDALAPINSLTADNTFGAANIRAMSAPLLAIGIVTLIGAVKSEFAFLVPAPLYFLMLIVTRIVSLITEGSDLGIIRALIIAVVFSIFVPYLAAPFWSMAFFSENFILLRTADFCNLLAVLSFI